MKNLQISITLILKKLQKTALKAAKCRWLANSFLAEMSLAYTPHFLVLLKPVVSLFTRFISCFQIHSKKTDVKKTLLQYSASSRKQ